MKFKILQKKRLIIILVIVTVLLLIPFIAMQFTDEVHWALGDFVVAGILLFLFFLMCELAVRKIKIVSYRVLVCVAFLIVLILVWAELGVGIFGTPFAGD